MSERIRNAPNFLGVLRVMASPLLLAAAAWEEEALFLALFLAVAATDFLDGLLARALDQETTFGARLDTVADAVMYGCALVGLVWLEGDLFLGEWPWMAVAVGAYALSWVLSLRKFGRLPGYHTWSARGASVLAVGAVVALLLAGEPWPVRVAAVAVTLANLEAATLTLMLDSHESDLTSVVPLLLRQGIGPSA